MEDNTMQEPDPPKIEFPCDYPVKVLGVSSDAYESIIFEVFERHAPGFDQETMTVNVSSKGTFTSLTITITATGPEQLEALHQDLLATGHVKMVI
jgi:putative lipoic acid-binding regulatory protein